MDVHGHGLPFVFFSFPSPLAAAARGEDGEIRKPSRGGRLFSLPFSFSFLPRASARAGDRGGAVFFSFTFLFVVFFFSSFRNVDQRHHNQRRREGVYLSFFLSPGIPFPFFFIWFYGQAQMWLVEVLSGAITVFFFFLFDALPLLLRTSPTKNSGKSLIKTSLATP